MDSDLIMAVCPVCISHHARFLRKYRYHQPLFKGCSIVECENCKLVFVHPMPDEKALVAYNAGYFSNAHGGISVDRLTIAFHSAINLLRVLHVGVFVQQHNRNIRNVLEIGPGAGHFARHLRSKYPGILNYTVVESDTSCHPNLQVSGVIVYTSIDQLPSDEQFDLIVISHVLEHTNDPVQFLSNCTKYLVTGGILFIEVPCNDYAHKNSDEPHLLFFDKGPMNLLLTKTGFDDIHLSYHGKTISELQRPKPFYSGYVERIKNILLRKGIVLPFAVKDKELKGIDNSLERAVIKPFQSHVEQTEPAWWLRALSIKK